LNRQDAKNAMKARCVQINRDIAPGQEEQVQLPKGPHDMSDHQTSCSSGLTVNDLSVLCGRRFFLWLCGSVLLAASATLRAEVICPDVLNVEQNATPPSAEWQVSNLDRPSRLIGVTLYDGLPPDRRVRPTVRSSSGSTLSIRWQLYPNRRGYYLMCSYEHTSARLYTALPPGVLLCEVAYDLNVSAVGGHPVKRMVCK
jgi:hypothetical protein